MEFEPLNGFEGSFSTSGNSDFKNSITVNGWMSLFSREISISYLYLLFYRTFMNAHDFTTDIALGVFIAAV